jgi:hypothetical protein
MHTIGAGEVEELRVFWTIDTPIGVTSLAIAAESLEGYAVGNIDDDPEVEIVLGEDGVVDATELIDRQTQSAFLQIVDDLGAPRLGDLDGDGVLDLVVGSATGFRVYRGIPFQD